MVLMKRYFLLFIALVAFATGCSNDDDNARKSIDIVGEWHCTPAEFTADVYVAFMEDGSFDLYQMVGQGRYRHFDGSWSVERNILSGSYADGTPWGSSYAVTKLDDNTLTLTAENGSMEVMTYYRESIPASVKEESTDVRSLDSAEQPIL